MCFLTSRAHLRVVSGFCLFCRVFCLFVLSLVIGFVCFFPVDFQYMWIFCSPNCCGFLNYSLVLIVRVLRAIGEATLGRKK